ncbi:MAG: hypothetical protein VR64_13770 [Desulfatitalea sp. BRH_c12]|jgi:hypothetical protein|nr:MAG: hypothetical protein VR64_13770 [Desulfatitalea sp. BRH_c12]
MGKVFRPSNRESSILSKIESSKEHARRRTILSAREHVETLGGAIASKLVEHQLVETTNKNSLEEQIVKCLETLCHADDFDIDYLVSPYRQVVQQPNVVSLYVTAFLLEKLINHKSVVDIFGSDFEIYGCINQQVNKILP